MGARAKIFGGWPRLAPAESSSIKLQTIKNQFIMNFFSTPKIFRNENLPGESEVMNGLSLSPSEVVRMTAQGKSIAMHSLDSMLFSAPCENLGDFPLEYTRGIDENTLFETSLRARKKIKDYRDAQSRSVSTSMD